MPDNLEKRGDFYYWSARVNGRRFRRSLKTGNRRAAIGLAAKHRAAAEAGRFDALDEVRVDRSCCTLDELTTDYRRVAAMRGIKERTAANYCSALGKIIRTVHGQGYTLVGTSAKLLTGDLVQRYAELRVAGTGSDELRRRATRSAISTLTQARAVTSPWARQAMRVSLPDLTGWLGAQPLRPAPVVYRLPPEDLVNRTLDAARELAGSDRDLYLVFLLCYHLALRSGEAVAAEWSWFRTAQAPVVLDLIPRPHWCPKGRPRSLPVHETVWGELAALRVPGASHILPGDTSRSREDLVGRRFAGWMRAQGWSAATYPKAAHELRKLQGARWYSEIGAEVAQTWLGHISIETTCRHYATLTRSPPPLALG